jgi:hypothetical protein
MLWSKAEGQFRYFWREGLGGQRGIFTVKRQISREFAILLRGSGYRYQCLKSGVVV